MRLLLTADWHLSDNPRDSYRFGAAELVHRVARKKGAATLVILGDLTDDRDHHSAGFTNRVVELLKRISDDGIRVIILRGNHDAADPNVPFFRFLSAIPGLSYVTQIEVWGIGGHSIAFIPNGAWPDVLPEARLILTHATFSGARAENDSDLRGLRLPYRSPPIFSGDVHVPQRQGPVIYVGPPTLIRFGDSYEPRVVLLDEKLQASSIKLTGPTKRLVNVVADPYGKCAWPAHPVVNRGDILKIRVTFDAAPLPPMSYVRSSLDEAAKRLGASIYSIIPMLDRRVSSLPTTSAVAHSDADLVRRYADTQSYDEPTRGAGLKIVGKQ